MRFFDKLTISDTRRTSDGYLAVSARVARTGIQVYRGHEVGRPRMKEVRVYRPPQEVFAKDALHSFAHRPLTNDHPPEEVNSKNWRKYSIGHTGDEVARDGEFIRVPMVLMDEQAISDVTDGKRELSAGYSCDLDWTPGKTEDGLVYDAVQRDIRGNHIAVVDLARGGSNLRIDHKPGDSAVKMTECPECGEEIPANAKKCPDCGHVMKDTADVTAAGRRRHGDSNRRKSMKTITVDGVPVELDDQSAAFVQRTIDRLQGEVTTLITARDKLTTDAGTATATIKDLESKISTKDGEIAALKQQVKDAEVTPAKLDELVKDRAAVVGKASAVMGDKLVIDGRTLGDIRRQVVAFKLGDAVAKEMKDEAIDGAFSAFTADVKASDTKVMSDAFRRSGHTQTTDVREQAWMNQGKKMADAWKNKPGQA